MFLGSWLQLQVVKVHAMKQNDVLIADCIDMAQITIDNCNSMKAKDVKIEEIQHSCTYQSMITRKVRILTEEPANGSISGENFVNSIICHESMICNIANLQNESSSVNGLSYADVLKTGRRLLHKRNAGQQIHSKDHEANCSHSLVQNVRDEGCSMIAQTSDLINENLTSPSSESSKELPDCLHARKSGEFRYVVGKSEFTQEVVRSLEARDDDDNVSVPLEATSTLLFGEALHPIQPPFTGSESKLFQNCGA